MEAQLEEAERGFNPGPAGVHGNLKVGINPHGIHGKEPALFKTALAYEGEVVFE